MNLKRENVKLQKPSYAARKDNKSVAANRRKAVRSVWGGEKEILIAKKTAVALSRA